MLSPKSTKMTDTPETEYQAWEEDVQFLVRTLAEIFESDAYRYHVDDINNLLYIELGGLDKFDEEEIVELAEPVLSELDLDFEDVILVPLNGKPLRGRPRIGSRNPSAASH